MSRPVAAEYLDVAQRTLFTKDRNPNVIVEPLPAPPPPPPVPPLPVYRGQMSIGDQPVVFLATGPADEKGYRKGDTAGKFKVVAFDRDNITLEWDGRILEHKLTDLVNHDAVQPVQQYAAAVPTAPPPVTNLGGATAKNLGSSNDNPALGVDMGGPRACVAGDNSPAGTMLSGYRKVITQGLMGQSCHWEPVSR